VWISAAPTSLPYNRRERAETVKPVRLPCDISSTERPRARGEQVGVYDDNDSDMNHQAFALYSLYSLTRHKYVTVCDHQYADPISALRLLYIPLIWHVSSVTNMKSLIHQNVFELFSSPNGIKAKEIRAKSHHRAATKRVLSPERFFTVYASSVPLFSHQRVTKRHQTKRRK
jgi:hypothetical protein